MEDTLTVSLPIIDAVDGKLFSAVVLMLERIYRARFRIDECSDLLRFLVGQTARIEIGHCVANDAGKRINPRCTSSIVPGIGTPERSRFLVSNFDALAILSVTVRAMLHKERFSPVRVQLLNRNHVRRRDDILATPGRIFAD